MSYLLFVWKPSGYELHERDGDPPGVGATVELDGKTLRVTKVGPSPLPATSGPARTSAARASQFARVAIDSARTTSPSTSACASPLA